MYCLEYERNNPDKAIEFRNMNQSVKRMHIKLIMPASNLNKTRIGLAINRRGSGKFRRMNSLR